MIEASVATQTTWSGLFAPGFGVGTVRKIAANAVMAGCAPNTMPVIMAMMDCILDPSMGLRTWAMSTGPQAPIVLVSGSDRGRDRMNRGICALGPGSISQVNVAIGRALRLIMMNVGLSYPGVSDMDTIGTPMKFSACVAENENARRGTAGACRRVFEAGLDGQRQRALRHDRVLRLQEPRRRAA
jgi:hypothetical protein